MARGDQPIDHLLRRAGFGANLSQMSAYNGQSLSSVIDSLVDYQRLPDDVDSNIGKSTYVGITTRGQFSPNTVIDDARQRWLFRMVHSQRPLQEKMALFWHNHFGVGYTKVAGFGGSVQGTKMMALKSGELPGPQGHLELLRQNAVGKFRDLLVAVARDPAMVVFLDGRTNLKAKPQENFGREIMELFTWGVGNYTEEDVYAAARVFTGWNLRNGAGFTNSTDPNSFYEYVYNSAQHDTTAKTFTFPIYGNGSKTIAARSAAQGEQDGLDLIAALTNRPETGARLAKKLWNFFVSELTPPDSTFVSEATRVYLENDTEIKPVLQYIFRSRWFLDSASYFTRYSWPAEFVARSIKEIGWDGFSVDTARTPLTNMGQTLFEPPNVAGWELGPAWISTGAMLSRMNFAATLAANQKFNIARSIPTASRTSPDKVLQFLLDRYSTAPFDGIPSNALVNYARANITAWTGSDSQVQTKSAGLARLIVASSEFQLV